MAVRMAARRDEAIITPPEPDLTPDEMLRRAVAMRPVLRERQDATEALQQQLGVVPTDVADTVHP